MSLGFNRASRCAWYDLPFGPHRFSGISGYTLWYDLSLWTGTVRMVAMNRYQLGR